MFFTCFLHIFFEAYILNQFKALRRFFLIYYAGHRDHIRVTGLSNNLPGCMLFG